MRFADPALLWLLLGLPALAAASWWAVARKQRALRLFAGGAPFVGRFTSEIGRHRRAAKLLLLYFALLAAILAVARPQWGTSQEEVAHRGADVMVVLDTSLSMAAEDVSPSRLELARNAIAGLVERLAGDRIGFVTFAGRPALECPLTIDHAAVQLFLDAVTVESTAVPGTALAEALGVAMDALSRDGADSGDRSRAIVLFSDGEDHEGGLDEVLSEIEPAGVGVFAVGCGTTRGAPIPLEPGRGADAGYKLDHEGKVVTTRLNETLLEGLALSTGGMYRRATSSGAEVDVIADALLGLEGKELGALLRTRYEERFQIPLGLALLALLAETLLGDRRRVPAPQGRNS